MNLIIHLAIYNLVISILLYASLAYNPRMWMHRMPPEVVQKVPPRTPAEKRLLYFFGISFLLEPIPKLDRGGYEPRRV